MVPLSKKMTTAQRCEAVTARVRPWFKANWTTLKKQTKDHNTDTFSQQGPLESPKIILTGVPKYHNILENEPEAQYIYIT